MSVDANVAAIRAALPFDGDDGYPVYPSTLGKGKAGEARAALDALVAERDRAVRLIRQFRQWDDLPGRMAEADTFLAALAGGDTDGR